VVDLRDHPALPRCLGLPDRAGPQDGRARGEAAHAQDAALRQYVQNATTTSPADELTKLADLRASGAIDDAEYQQLKAKVLA
jgi:Short C-terminal domain